jgi:hypothetical protein
MTMTPPNFAFVSLAAAALVALTGCDSGSSGPKIKITYSQVGVCNGYDGASDATAKRANQALVAFKIDSIDSTGSDVNFNFEPTRLFVDLAPHKETWGSSIGAGLYFASADRRFTAPLGIPTIEDLKIPAKTTTEVGRIAFIPLVTTDANGAAEAAKTSYTLLYDAVSRETSRSADPKVELVKSNESQSSWEATDDCRQLASLVKK